MRLVLGRVIDAKRRTSRFATLPTFPSVRLNWRAWWRRGRAVMSASAAAALGDGGGGGKGDLTATTVQTHTTSRVVVTHRGGPPIWRRIVCCS